MPKVITMPHGAWGNDSADWQGTPEEFRAKMAEAEGQQNAPSEPAKRIVLLTPDELGAMPVAAYRIKSVLPMTGVAVIYGAPKSGKTFLVLDAAAAITEGRDWFGFKTKVAPVTYVGLEGQAGLAQRWRAYRLVRGNVRKAALHFVTVPLSLLASGDLLELAGAIHTAKCEGGVVIVDTLNAASPGADENSSVDMGRIIEGAKQLQREVGGLVLLVHHSGKDTSRGLRGHSSLSGALDAILEVSRNESGDRREWKVERAKDGPESDAIPFTLSVVELGVDGDGDPITSCVVEIQERLDTGMKRNPRPPGGNQKLALKAIEQALLASEDYGKGGAPGFRPCLSYEQAIEAASSVLPVDKNRQKERARLAISGLVSAGHLAYREEWIWLP